jgi:hypothetical protein
MIWPSGIAKLRFAPVLKRRLALFGVRRLEGEWRKVGRELQPGSIGVFSTRITVWRAKPEN